MIYEIWYMINYIPYATSLFNQFFLIPRCFWWQISLPPRGSTESPLRIEQLANGTGKEVKLICLKGLRQVGHDLKPESVKSTAKRLDGPGLNHWGFPTIRPAIKPWNVWGGWYVREGLVDFRHKLMLQKSEWINTWHPVNSGINLPFPQLVTLPDFWSINSTHRFQRPAYGRYTLVKLQWYLTVIPDSARVCGIFCGGWKMW